MRQHSFGRLPPVSTLTLGGGGLGMLWGETSFAECVATVHAAVAAGITLFDLAPRYGDGKAEEVVGAAFAVQCIANLIGSPGGLKFFDGPAKPRAIMAAARANRVGVMGIRAVQAGALTAAIDRRLPEDHPEMRDYARADGFRQLAAELGENPA